jgi:hypothetical protein
MAWEVEVTDEWLAWYDGLPEGDQDELAAVIGLLEAQGPQLGFPYTSGVTSSEHPHMRELRVQSRGSLCGCCTRSTRVALHYCCSAAIRPETNVGTSGR